jgi:hypothetical protein
MKKIRVSHNKKDCIRYIFDGTKQSIYYQPYGTKEQLWLFDSKFSYSIYSFFHKNGRRLGDNCLGISLAELYEVGHSRNFKIDKLLDRIPAQVDYVLGERHENKKCHKKAIVRLPECSCFGHDDDDDRVA